MRFSKRIHWAVPRLPVADAIADNLRIGVNPITMRKCYIRSGAMVLWMPPRCIGRQGFAAARDSRRPSLRAITLSGRSSPRATEPDRRTRPA